jgi:hypothetical protein
MVAATAGAADIRAPSGVAAKVLAEEMHAVFTSEDVHREAMAALLLFQNAVRREAVTSELVEEISTYLRRARGNPAMSFKSP